MEEKKEEGDIAIKLRKYMCVLGTDALASANVWAKLKHHFQEQKSLI